MSDNEWKRPESPPPPLFLGKKERDLVKQVNDELIENVIGQQVLYFPIDIEHTDFHPLYGEAVKKTFLSPIRVYALIDWEGFGTTHSENIGVDKESTITIHFHKRRLSDDQDLYVREGDFVCYGDYYFEIVGVDWSKLLFGQINHTFEITATCIQARKGIFDAS